VSHSLKVGGFVVVRVSGWRLVREFARECVVAVSGSWALAFRACASAPGAERLTLLAQARLEMHVTQVVGWCGGVAEALAELPARRPRPTGDRDLVV
jgi:hypothetical protein